MIRRLRARFIRIALTALSVAMILVTLIINGANWIIVRSELTETARFIASSGGRYPRMGRGGRRASRESPYETRYFSVKRNGKGRLVALNMENIAFVTEEEALELARRASETGRECGFLGDFLYYIDEDRSVITFIDCETRLGAVRALGWISLAACVAGIALSLLIASLLSRRAIEPLIESAEKQRRFITDAGHELKTPLTVISANMDILRLDLGDNEWVEGTQRQVANLRRLTGDLITLSRMDEESSPMACNRFSLSGAVKDTCQGFSAMAETTGRVLTQRISPGILIDGDEGAIRRLVSILTDNAIKYSPKGDEIVVTLTADGRRARLSVRNELNAPLGDAQLAQLFDRFYRADPARAKEQGKTGYGLGLAIARSAAERHGGRLSALREGDGIAMICTLPRFKEF